MESELKRRMVYSILEFLNEENNAPETTADAKESLEVAVQCLETAFGVTLQDGGLRGRRTLREIFVAEELQQVGAEAESMQQGVGGVDLGAEYELPKEATEGEKLKAEEFKNKGNDAMRNSNYSEALGQYTKAVELDGRNSVFFCNRAAAYIKLEQFENALRDCQIAIRLQPNYARAYGRMGVSYSNRNMHVEAILCYKKALTLEPNNESYLTNLRYSQNLLAQQAQQGGEAEGAGGAPGFGLGGLENIMRNPNLINMASQMLRDPAMHQMVQNIMGGLGGQMPTEPMDVGGNGGGGGGVGGGGVGGGLPNQPPPGMPNLPFENLVQMGQAIANSIRSSNPELAEQLGVGGFPFGNENNPHGGPSGDDNVPES